MKDKKLNTCECSREEGLKEIKSEGYDDKISTIISLLFAIAASSMGMLAISIVETAESKSGIAILCLVGIVVIVYMKCWLSKNSGGENG